MKSLKRALITARLLENGLTHEQIQIAELTYAGMDTLSVAKLMKMREERIKSFLTDFYSRFDIPKLPRGRAA